MQKTLKLKLKNKLRLSQKRKAEEQKKKFWSPQQHASSCFWIDRSGIIIPPVSDYKKIFGRDIQEWYL